LELQNVTITNVRAESLPGHYDFVVSRAVAHMETFERWVHGRVYKKNRHALKNGILYLKGGDLTEELAGFPRATVYPLSNYFEEAFFETKTVVHLPLKFKG
jgi:16S rRNA (guanine527-N7)-methyltransferase